MNSDSAAEQVTALDPELRGFALEQDLRLVPSGLQIRLLPESFESTGNVAVLEAELTDGRRYSLVLTLVSEQWLIVSTTELL